MVSGRSAMLDTQVAFCVGIGCPAFFDTCLRGTALIGERFGLKLRYGFSSLGATIGVGDCG